MSRYLTKAFLFDINRSLLGRSDKLFLIVGGLFLLFAALFKLASMWAPSAVDAKFRKKFFVLFFSIGLAQVVWFGCRTQYINFFGSHFTALTILFIGLVWLVFLFIDIFKNYRKEKNQWEKEQVKLKYLAK